MVNLVDTFTRVFGKAPTEEQIGVLMKAKAQREAALNKRIAPPDSLIDKSKKFQATAKVYAGRKEPENGILLPIRAYTINKLLGFNLSPEQIAEALDVNMSFIEKAIEHYKLPRKKARRKLG